MKYNISIIYVYYNTPSEIADSVASIKNAIKDLSHEIIIVNNASLVPLPKLPRNIKILNNKKNIGFGAAINKAAKIAQGKYFLIVNPDTLLIKNSIQFLYEKLENDKKIGIIAPELLNKDRSNSPNISSDPQGFQALFAFSILNKLFPHNKFSKNFWLTCVDRKKKQLVPVVGGACFMVSKKLFVAVGGFDERFFMYFEESDICYRVRNMGYKVVYFPKAKVIHYIGRSSTDATWIQQQFENSRKKYLIKYHGSVFGTLLEYGIRLLQPYGILLSLILITSTFLNLYKITTLMMFFGDFGRDYLAARDVVLYHRIPLEGIQTSVVWLHQGPLSIYLIAFALFAGKFAPYAPAILYGIIGVFSTYLVYLLGKTLFSTQTGLLAAAFYATSPLVIISTRMPYHTSIISFFACLFFYVLYKVISGKKKLLPLTVFLFGILLLLELSNVVLILILLIVWFLYKLRLSIKQVSIAVGAFIISILPFVIYEATHSFIQSHKILQAIIKHISSFHQNVGNTSTLKAGTFAWEQATRFVFPANHLLVFIIIVAALCSVFFSRRIKQKGVILINLLLWIPLCLYIVRGATSFAYYPLLFAPMALFLGLLFAEIARCKKFFLIPIIALFVWNGIYTVSNNYFLDAEGKIGSQATGWNYGLGTTLQEQQNIARAIVKDSRNKKFRLVGESQGFNFSSDIDNYIYLVWYDGGKFDETAKETYAVAYRNNVVVKGKIVYEDKFIIVSKN